MVKAFYKGEPGGTVESDRMMEQRLEPDGGTGFGGKVGAVTRITRSSLEMGMYPSERYGWVMQRVGIGAGVPALISALAAIPFLGNAVAIVGVGGSVLYTVGHLLHAVPQKRGDQLIVSSFQSQAILGLIIYVLSLGGYVAIQNELGRGEESLTRVEVTRK